MTGESSPTTALRPADFCRQALKALDAAEGRRRRRKRDQTPDAIGLEIKRDLYERAVTDDPAPEAFEAWLLAQVLSAFAAGPVRAIAVQILDEFRFSAADPAFREWLAAGAHSADAELSGSW